MNERDVRDRLAAAIGEPPSAEAAVRRLEAHLEAAPDRRPERDRPRGMALLAGALALLLVGGLLATQAARRAAEPARSPAGGRGPAPVVTPFPSAPAAPALSSPDASGCRAGAPPQLVVIDLARQELTAYDHGCPFLNAPVTTGGRAVPTGPGVYRVQSKLATFTLHSPWPRGDPLWYPDTTVHDYIACSGTGLTPHSAELRPNGYGGTGFALHSAEWEPDAAFGPGSENGAYGSHGTVHVPTGALDRLYGWVQAGATVMTVAGS
jgi:hypothetical protein